MHINAQKYTEMHKNAPKYTELAKASNKYTNTHRKCDYLEFLSSKEISFANKICKVFEKMRF